MPEWELTLEKTFSGERYTIWTMQSNYHNLPMINDVSAKIWSEL